MRTVSLATLRAKVRKESDTLPDTTAASARHPNADLNQMINDSWQALRRMLTSSNGARELYCKPATGTLTVGATAPFAWGVLTLPTDLAHVVGLEITLANGKRRALQPTSWAMRNEVFNEITLSVGPPRGFFIYNVGTEAGSSVTAGSLGIVPAPDSAYPYTLWYLPPWVNRTLDTDVFDGFEGFEDWVVWDCVVKIAAADNDMANTYRIAMGEREKVEAAIMRAANAIQRVGVVSRQDMVGLEQRDNIGDRWRW